uniref:Actin-related protein 6 n=1 Tax=Magallana gigas TaxID=29159 RepID=K1QNF4_MAGGI
MGVAEALVYAISTLPEGGCMLANTEDYKKMAVTREQYEEHGHTICSEKFDI